METAKPSFLAAQEVRGPGNVVSLPALLSHTERPQVQDAIKGHQAEETASEGEGATRPQLLSGHRKHKTGCSPRTKVSTINYLPFNNLRGVTS